jgi:PAS domain S-box-containing protein
MNIKPTTISGSGSGKLQAIFNADKNGYFKNTLALAASICGASCTAIIGIENEMAEILAHYGFKDNLCTIDPGKLMANNAGDLLHHGFIVDGLCTTFFKNTEIAIANFETSIWLCIMDSNPLAITPQQINQLNLLVNQVSAVIPLLAAAPPTNATQVDRQLQEQKTFYEKILNKIPTDIAVFDADHRYLFINPSAISIKELREYIIGKDDYEYVAYRNRDIAIAHARREKFNQAKQTRKVVHWEEDIKRPDGSIATILRYFFPVVEDNDEVSLVIGYGIDISDRKLMEEKQSDLVKQLSVQNTQLIDFCNIVSHNLRAPLVNMTMLVDFMKETDDPAEHQLLIEKLDPVIKNLHATFNELVESIQVKQDLEVEATTMNLNDVLERCLNSLGTEMDRQSITLSHNFDAAPVVHFPPKYLHSIFHNFLSNASKYRSPMRNLVIDIKSSKRGGNVILQFEDNGLGIDLKKHGQKLFKIGKVFHDHADAKGFGLYMTKTQIEAMGGRVWVESTPNKGSVFYVEFTKQA